MSKAIFLVLLMIPNICLAIECGPKESYIFDDYLSEAHDVFVGRVNSIALDEDELGSGKTKIEIQSSIVFKGSPLKKINIGGSTELWDGGGLLVGYSYIFFFDEKYKFEPCGITIPLRSSVVTMKELEYESDSASNVHARNISKLLELIARSCGR